MNPFTPVQWIAIAAPLVLIWSMRVTFRVLTRRFGTTKGYLAAFALYGVVWCVGLPLALLGVPGIERAFRMAAQPLGEKPALAVLLMAWPLLGPLLFRVPLSLRRLNLEALGLSVLLGVLIGFGEELLWRGVYLQLFDGLVTAMLWPALAFALWHLAPLSVRPNSLPGGSASFVVYSFVLGLSYAVAAALCGSILFVAIAHALHDTLGLPGLLFVEKRRPGAAPLRPAHQH